jgi:hypothetical protein
MFVLNARPDTFNLPAQPQLPRANILPAALSTLAAAVGLGLAAALALRPRR